MPFGLDFDSDGMEDGMPAVITVKEILDEENNLISDNFYNFNKFEVQAMINGGEVSILAASGNPAVIFKFIPSLFDWQEGGNGVGVLDATATAVVPGAANLQPVS